MNLKDRVLLVEGKDDREVIYQFCNHCEIDNRTLLEVKACGSVEELIKSLGAGPKAVEQVLAAVVDADSDLSARWRQICDALAPHGYSLPVTPDRGGTICESPRLGRPRLGLWLMPDNQVTGMLEDFLMSLIAADEALLPRARAAVDSIPAGERLFGATKTSKAALHTWLAWQEEPGTPTGQAITKRYLDPAIHPAPAFEAWLRELFVPSA